MGLKSHIDAKFSYAVTSDFSIPVYLNADRSKITWQSPGEGVCQVLIAKDVAWHNLSSMTSPSIISIVNDHIGLIFQEADIISSVDVQLIGFLMS